MKSGQSVLITGGGAGIGRAVSLLLAERGFAVTIVDRDEDAATATATLIASRGASALAVTADVTSLPSLVSAAADSIAQWGGINAVVSCAGIEVVGSILELEPVDWKRSFDVNATGVFNVAKATMPELIRNSGTFVAISSDAGTQGCQGYSAYSAAKHAVVGLVKSMALDYGPLGVRSNVVCPAFVETAMADRIFETTDPGEADFYRQAIPLGRFARPHEVASVIGHLISEEASYANGLVYSLDGGGTAGAYRALPEAEVL